MSHHGSEVLSIFAPFYALLVGSAKSTRIQRVWHGEIEIQEFMRTKILVSMDMLLSGMIWSCFYSLQAGYCHPLLLSRNKAFIPLRT